MEALKITWTFTHPMVVPDHPVHLDALLAWASVDQASRAGKHDPVAAQDDLPLGRMEGIWQASRLVFKPATEVSLLQIIRAYPAEEIASARANGIIPMKGKNAFPMGSGHFKAYDLRLPLQWIECAVAWCIGDREEIRKLLDQVKCIGRLTRNGWGRVGLRVIEPDPRAQTYWRCRVLPAQAQLTLPDLEYVPAIQTFHPPYWDRAQRKQALVPLSVPPDAFERCGDAISPGSSR